MSIRYLRGELIRPQRDYHAPLEAFYLGHNPMNTEEFKRRPTAILSTDVVGYSPLMEDGPVE